MATSPPLRFCGRPGAVEGLLPMAVGEDLAIVVALPDTADVVVQAAPVGGGTLLRLVLPPGTAPGSYEGHLRAGEQRLAVVLDVEPDPHLVVTPSRVRVRAPSGAEVDVSATVANDGNVPVEIPARQGFGLFQAGGVDDALGAALRDEKSRGADRLGRLADEVAARHGGLGDVVLDRPQLVEPGDARTLALRIRLPDGLRPGRSYTGLWPLANLRTSVQVEVVESEEPPWRAARKEASA